MQETSAAAALVAGGSDALTTAADEAAATAAEHLGAFLSLGELSAYDDAVSTLGRVRNLAKLAQM
ncbi:MAG: hypothetical protein HOU81_27555, partial [Hamadaea sp.]|nr:hypothetical protein [Hamadaea sp.]